MIRPAKDDRKPERVAKDDRIAAEPPLPPLESLHDEPTSPVEGHLARLAKRLLAVAGVVENGLVRPLDPDVKLREHSRVIIVATDPQ